MELVVLGLSHRTAPVEVREQFAIADGMVAEAAAQLRLDGVLESMIVSTCNRVELYATGPDPEHVGDALRGALTSLGGSRRAVVDHHIYRHAGAEAVRHLFRVAASLDSMVVGEPQILGQLKSAYLLCREAGVTGPSLGRAVERAFSVAKKVRNETGIARHAVSVSSVAVDLARQIFGDLTQSHVALVGAGKMGELAARHLVQAGVSGLWVANRSMDRAQRLAERLEGVPRALEDLPQLLVEADIVITSTGHRGYLIDRKMAKRALRARKYRPIFVIDIAVPRNVDPGLNSLDNVYAYDVDDLNSVADENLSVRRREAAQAEALVEREAVRFIREQAGLAVKPTVIALRKKAMAIKAAELARAEPRLGALDPKQRKAVEVLADGVVNKMLHDVLTTLRREAGEPSGERLLAAARALFLLDDVDDGDP